MRVLCSLAALAVWTGCTAAPGTSAILERVQLPSSLFVGAALCTIALGLGQKTLQVPFTTQLTWPVPLLKAYLLLTMVITGITMAAFGNTIPPMVKPVFI